MRTKTSIAIAALMSFGVLTASAPGEPTAQEIMKKVLDTDPFGMSGSSVSAHLVVKDKAGSVRLLAFKVRSIRYDPPFAKSLVRFTAPADLAGAGFLQVQNRSSDDDRFMFLPELQRSRRIAGSMRSSAFMGTDFSFADLDRRDLREADAKSQPEETLGKYACYRVDLTPKRSDSPYAKLEAWVRKDNFLPLQLKMYDHAQVLVKTLTAQEVRRVDGEWFITKSRMLDHVHGHSTELLLESIAPLTGASEDEFTVRTLEKI